MVKDIAAARLRRSSEDADMLERAAQQKASYYPPKILRSGEKILFPLRVVFGNQHPTVLDSLKAKRFAFRQKVLEKLQRLDGNQLLPVTVIEFYKRSEDKRIDKRRTVVFELRVREWIEALERDPTPVERDEEFVFGPSIRIESIDVNDKALRVRGSDPERFVIHSELHKGSCPFVYTYSARSGTWENQGHILYGRNSRDKEGGDEIEISDFNGRIRLRERDPETSFIDFVYVRAVKRDGTTELLLAKDHLLRKLDGHYLVLEQGQEVEVEFEMPVDPAAGSFVVGAHGYYVPYTEGTVVSAPDDERTTADGLRRAR